MRLLRTFISMPSSDIIMKVTHGETDPSATSAPLTNNKISSGVSCGIDPSGRRDCTLNTTFLRLVGFDDISRF